MQALSPSKKQSARQGFQEMSRSPERENRLICSQPHLSYGSDDCQGIVPETMRRLFPELLHQHDESSTLRFMTLQAELTY